MCLVFIPVSTWLQRMMVQYPFIELFVPSRDIDMMINISLNDYVPLKDLFHWIINQTKVNCNWFLINVLSGPKSLCNNVWNAWNWWCLRQNITANDIWRHIFLPVSTWLQRMMVQYPFIELFVPSRDIDMMIHAIKLLNNYALKSSVKSKKVYYLTYMDLSNRFNYDYILLFYLQYKC
jgi:hypothetical protein